MILQDLVVAVFPPAPPTNVVIEFQCDCKSLSELEKARCIARLVWRRIFVRVAMCVAAVISPPSSRRIWRHSTLVGGEGEKPVKIGLL